MSVRRQWFTAVTVLLLLLGWVSALEIRVDDEGGPADLADRVDAAVDAWRTAGADVEAVDRTVLVRYGDAALLGPDALSLVITGGPPGVDLEVVVQADAGDELDDALVVAIGIALGGTPGLGVLDPRLAPGEERRPGSDDAAALAPGVGLPGDITGDGEVGFDDLLELAAAWGRQGINLPADLDGDGVIGDGDLDVLREHYQFAPIGTDEDRPAAEPPGEDADVVDEPVDEEPGDHEPADDERLDGEPVDDEPANGEPVDDAAGAEPEDDPGDGE